MDPSVPLEEQRESFAESKFHRSLLAAFDNLVDGVIVADTSGKLLHWNQSSIKMRGFTHPEEACVPLDEIRRKFCLRYPDGTELPIEDWPIPRMVRGETVKNLECRVSRIDTGREWVVLYNGSRILDPENDQPLLILTLHDLTNERQSQLELDRTGRLLEAIYKSSSNGILIKDLAGKYLFANPAAAAFSGLTPDEIIGKYDADLLAPDSLQAVREQDEEVFRTGNTVVREYSLTVGEITRLHVGTKTPYLDGSGNIIGLIGIVRDVTEERAAERELRESESRFRELADAIPQIVWIAEPDGAIGQLNQRALEFTGLDHESLQGWNWGNAIHPDDLERVLSDWNEIRETKIPRPLQFRIRSHDGFYRWHITREVPIRSETGKVLRWYGTCTDIHDQIMAEEALRSSELRFRTFVQNSADAFFLHDDRGVVLDVNDQACESLGYSREELVGKTPFDFDPDITIDRMASIQKALDVGEQTVLESTYRRKDGSLFPVEVRLSGFYLDGRRQAVASVHDISKRRAAEDSLRESEERYRLALEAAELGTWRHDLTTNKFAMDRRCQKHHGFEAERVDFGKIVQRVHPDDRSRLRETMSTALQSKAQVVPTSEFRIFDETGQIRWLSISASVKFSPEGNPEFVIGTSMDITARKKADEELQRSESLLRSVIDNANSGIWVKDLNERYTLVNRYIETLLQRPSSDLIGRTASDLFSHEEAEEFTRNNRTVLDTQTMGVFEEKVQYRGKEATFVSVKFPIRDKQGQITSIGAICTDITERIEMERALRESEARLRIFVEHAGDAFSLHEAGGNIIDVNQQACDSTGYTREEMIGRPAQKFGIGFSREYEKELITRLDRGEMVTFEAMNRRRDGVEFPVEVRLRPFWIDGKRYSVALTRDISDRRRAEEELRSQQMFIQRIADASPHVFYVFDIRKQEVIYANRHTASDLGFSGEELEMYKGNSFLNLMHPDDAGKLPNLLGRWNTARDEEILETEYRLRDVNGKWHWFVGRDTVFTRTSDGQVEQIIGTAQDVTERRVLEDQLLQSQKMEAVGQLAGGVAHDFNNLLTVVNGYCDLLLMDDRFDEKNRDSVLAIREAGESAASLTQQLLAFGRRAIVTPQLISLNDLIRNLEMMLKPLIGEDILVRTILDGMLPSVNADRNQIEQVILNLAVNARDAMPRGGTLTIRTTVVRSESTMREAVSGLLPGDHVQLTVTDTGWGMDEHIVGRIFEPFFTTKESGKGTGLGLAVVHGIIKQSGGCIRVESRPGEGTTFYVLLPAVATETTPVSQGTRESIRGTGTVLLIEDEEAVRKILTLGLESNGYRVLAASGQHEAGEIVRQLGGALDLIVTDVVMPGRNGRELVEEIRQQHPGIPVLFISGYTDDEVVKRGVFSSTDAFLQKPFTPAVLARKVHELLHKRAT